MNFALFHKIKEIIEEKEDIEKQHSGKESELGFEVVLSDTEVNRSLCAEDIELVAHLISTVEHRSVHLPFYELSLGGNDTQIRNYSLKEICHAIDIADQIDAKKAVCHTTCSPMLPQKAKNKWFALFFNAVEKIEEKALASGVKIMWENTYEKDFELFDLMKKEFNPSFCLDIGHAHCFSNFKPEEFFNHFNNNISHIHLHDNKGDEDSHLALGCGTIDLPGFFSSIDTRKNNVTAVYEVSYSKYLESLKYLQQSIFV